jgi:hypothetical protein
MGDGISLKEALNQALTLKAAKVAAWTPANLREVTRVPTGTPPTPPERRRNERQLCWRCGKSWHFLRDGKHTPRETRDQASVVCWRCGKPGHFRRYCRQRPPENMDHDLRTRREPSVSSTPPRFTLKVLAKWTEDSLIADGWIQKKPCRITIDTWESVTIVRPDIVAGLPERELSPVRLTNGIRRNDSGREVGALKSDPSTTQSEDLGVRRRFHGRLHTGAGYLTGLRRVIGRGKVEVPMREAPSASVLNGSRLTESRTNSQPVCWQCDGTGHPRIECSRRTAKNVSDKGNWRRDRTTEGRGNARRQMAVSTPQLDEKQWLDGRTLALEGDIVGLRAPTAELEAALEGKVEAAAAVPDEEDSESEIQRRVTCRRLRLVAAVAPDDRDLAALRRVQLASSLVKACQNRLINSAGSSEGDLAGHTTRTRNRGNSPQHHPDQGCGIPGQAAS